MKTEILEHEKNLIKSTLEELEHKSILLTVKLNNLVDKTPFQEGLNAHFYGGRVGFMNAKDSAKKEREIEKEIDSYKDKKKIKEELELIEIKIKSLNTGNYLLRKNGLLVDSYKCLMEKKEAFDRIMKTNLLKGEPLSNEDKTIIKDLRKENLRNVNKREKAKI